MTWDIAGLLQAAGEQRRQQAIELTLGVLAAFQRAGRLGQVVAVGQNSDLLGRAALRRPDFPFIGSTAYSPETYGERLLDLALKILRGEPVPPAVYVPHAFVTRENIEQFYPEAGAGRASAGPIPANHRRAVVR